MQKKSEASIFWENAIIVVDLAGFEPATNRL